MTAANQPVDHLSLAAIKLHATTAPWALTGSTAALMYGRQRSTLDIDILVDTVGLNPTRFVGAFAPEYFLDRQMLEDSLRTGIMFNAIPLQGGPKLDLIPVNRKDDFEAWAFDSREPFDWHDILVWAIPAVAVAIAKLRWAARSGSERQLADVRGIMAMNEWLEDNRDFRYWVRTLQLEATLDLARSSRHDA